MACVPALRVDVLQLAVRLLPAPLSATAAQPAMVVPASEKLTGPVGALPVTVAVKVKLAPAFAGLAELARPVVDASLFTTCDSVALVDAALPTSPAYAATTLCVPAVNALVVQLAVGALPPPPSATALQPAMVVPPSVNATPPVGAVPVTVAVKVTLAPALAGLAELARPVVDASLFTTCDSVALVDAALPASPA
jgi:hypothetical protein